MEKNMKNVFQEVCNIIHDISGAENIKLSDLLKDNLGLDSLSLVEVLAESEERFHIVFDSDTLNPEEILHVSDIVTLIENLL